MNKFNIPILINKPDKKGNFIDHYPINNYIYKRRSISNDYELIFFAIHLTIKNKSRK